MNLNPICALVAMGCCALPAAGALSPVQKAQLPPPAVRKVDFIKDIQPILQVSCAQCHGRGKDKGSYRIDTRESFIKGGDSGPAVITGRSVDSLVIEMVSGLDPDNIMPQKGKRLTAEQVGVLRAWIDQGTKWPAEITFAPQPIENLKPQNPPVPAPSRKAGQHPVDRLLQPYYSRHKVKEAKLVEDRLFARRVWLDVVGLLPPPEELEAFVRDRAADKREQLVRRLLADNRRYAEHWLSFWNDLLRNDYRGTGYIDAGRKQITPWLYHALAANLRYDQMVAQLVNPAPEAEGFLKGIVWRGAVNSSQTPAMQAAQNVSQVFMGVNLKCASCHDSFINDYTLANTYALANLFSDEPLELFECDKPTGIKAGVGFFFPELGTISADAKRPERLRQLAQILTGPDNGRLSRTVVNRLWARFFGHGLVEPVDEMDHAAWHPELLHWLAEDLVAHDYDLKHTIATILTSQAYQHSAVAGAEGVDKSYVFRGPLVRRMTAEQFRDALTTLTGVGYAQPAAQVDWLAGLSSAQTQELRVFAAPMTLTVATATNHYMAWFAREFTVSEPVQSAIMVVAAADDFTLLLNGLAVGGTRKGREPVVVEVAPHIRTGLNSVVMQVGTKSVSEPANKAKKPASPPRLFPKSAMLYLDLHAGGKRVRLHGDTHWRFATGDDNIKPDMGRVAAWPALPAAALTAPPRGLDTSQLAGVIGNLPERGRYRAAWAPADPLAVALGRPNREQVCTARPSQATTLQALELTNGGSLAAILQSGSQKLAANFGSDARQLADLIFQRAMGRSPTPKESAHIAPLLGQPASPEGVADLLWSVAMLPEFQLIY